MPRPLPGKYIFWFFAAVICIPFLKNLLPILIPFLLGFGLALAAEPAVGHLSKKGGLRRGIAAGIGVTGVFVGSVALLILLLSMLLRQLGQLSQWLPDITETIGQGTALLRQWMLSLAEKTPAAVQPAVIRLIESLFDGGSGLLQQAIGKLPLLAGSMLGRLSHGFIGGITTALSAYMISARLPQLRKQFLQRIPSSFFPAARNFRKALGCWLLAQGKLAGVAFVLLWLGFLLLRIPNHFLWAVLVTMVDILPILGVGTVLVPWSLVCYLQGDVPKAVGLLGIFLVIWLVRSVLEPKIVSKELGLDPLVTLLCIYAGFRLWGIMGMLLAPVAAVCVVQLMRQQRADCSSSWDTDLS